VPKGTFYSVEKARISAAVSPVQQVSVVGEPVKVNINSVLIPEGIQVNVTAWSAGTIPISINVADIEGAIPISIRAEDIEGIIPISINADNIEGSIPISINASEIVGNISICIADVAGGVTIPVSGSVTISGTPSVTISGTPSVSISGTPSVNITGTPNINIASISGGVTIPVTGSVNISGTPNINIASVSSGVTMTVTGSVSITGTPSVTISGTPNVSITGTPNINIYSQTNGVWTKSEWAPKAGEAKYKEFTTILPLSFGDSAYVDYTVTSGKNLYITHVGFYLRPSSAPGSNVISGFCWINDNTAGQLLLNLGGNSGNGLSLATPLKVPGGNTVRILVCNCSSVSCYLSGSWGGFEV